jgi:hypothetical protein
MLRLAAIPFVAALLAPVGVSAARKTPPRAYC